MSGNDNLSENNNQAMDDALRSSTEEPVTEKSEAGETVRGDGPSSSLPEENVESPRTIYDEPELLDEASSKEDQNADRNPAAEEDPAASDTEAQDKKDEDEELPESAQEISENIEEVFDSLLSSLDGRHYGAFVSEIKELNPVDAADFLATLPMSRLPAVFRILPKDIAADIFAELDSDLQEKIISAMTDRELSNIVEDLYVDDAVDMLNELPANIVQRIMRAAKPDTRKIINRFLAYPEDSAGSVMTSEFIELKQSMTCAQAIDHIRRTGVDKETVYVAYVTGQKHVLLGCVPLKELLFASPDELIGDIMTDENFAYAYTSDDQETVASLISKYDLLALPVVDRENRLVGIVTVDDALDVLETEATEDIEKMAAIVPTDKPYMKTSVFETWKKRIPWLLLLMVSATFTSTIITFFENKLADFAFVMSLSAFIPMLMDTGGNAGSQSSVTIIRALSLNEITPRDIGKILWKEFRVSLLCGVTIAAACFLKTWIVDCRFAVDGEHLAITAVVSATIFFAILIAKMIGTLLPLLAKALKLDPAVMASPFITTIVDTLTLLIYFGIVTVVLIHHLL
ncbi:MAG: magnesium transporter [Clostridia bacterium]|nr:magnesium transporter [Clostridia bacterium]